MKVNFSLRAAALCCALAAVVFAASCQKKSDAPASGPANNQTGNQTNGQTTQQTNNQPSTFSVSGTTVTTAAIQRTVTLNGTVNSVLSVNVVPDVQGLIKEITVARGQFVKKGAELALVNASVAGNTFLSNSVKAPVSGQVAAILVEAGNNVTAQQAIIQLVDNSAIELKIAVSQQDAQYITKDTKGTLSFPSFAGGLADNAFDVSVYSISRAFSADSGTMRISVRLKESTQEIKSGMYASLTLVLEEQQNAVIIPEQSIVQRFVDDKPVDGVFVIENRQGSAASVSFRPLVFGIRGADGVEVVSGLAAGEALVTEGQRALTDGIAVSVFSIDGTRFVDGLNAAGGAAPKKSNAAAPQQSNAADSEE